MKVTIQIVIACTFFLTFLSSCDEPTSCPDDSLCSMGNTLTYQMSSNAATLIVENPEGAVFGNTVVGITDLIPGYPAQVNYTTPWSHFGGGMFKIEPFDLAIKEFITIKIKYPVGANLDYLGNNYAPELRLYYVDDWNWSVVNESYCDVERGEVIGKVLRLGTYAIAAERDMLEGDYIIPYENEFGYYTRLVFLHNSKGFREWVVDCDTALLVENWQLARDSFYYEYNKDSVSLINFTNAIICNYTSLTPAPDMLNISYTVDILQLTLEGMGSFQRKMK
ncbi:MAG: hypothetical protein K9I34_01225 [Bacteroidales bacterium]|nr:hypothetical protein [Bacteroidales bacterium]